MIEVKRFSPNLDSGVAFKGMDKDPNGKYVYFEDYNQLRQQLEAAEAQIVKLKDANVTLEAACILNKSTIADLEAAIREAREQKPVGTARVYLADRAIGVVTVVAINPVLSAGLTDGQNVYASPVPAMPIQDDKPSLAQQLEFVTAERDGIRKHRDQLIEKLGNAPHWVAIENPEDMPDDTEHVLWDGCDLSIDFTDTEVEYGTTFFQNGTEATHYLANLVPPQSEVKPS